MTSTIKEIKSRTRTGRLNFSIISLGNLIGERRTANSVAELLEIIPQRLKKRWEIIMFRNDEGNRVCITREFMEEGEMSIEETITDWLENVSQEELDERITAMGPEWGTTLEW